MSLFSLSTWSIFWAGWVKGIILGTWLLSLKKLGLIDKLLLEHVGLPHVLALAVHLVNFFCLMSQGGHSKQLLFFAHFYQSTPLCLKVIGWGGVGWGGVSGRCQRCWRCSRGRSRCRGANKSTPKIASKSPKSRRNRVGT